MLANNLAYVLTTRTKSPYSKKLQFYGQEIFFVFFYHIIHYYNFRMS